jgi:hypothetical protein
VEEKQVVCDPFFQVFNPGFVGGSGIVPGAREIGFGHFGLLAAQSSFQRSLKVVYCSGLRWRGHCVGDARCRAGVGSWGTSLGAGWSSR